MAGPAKAKANFILPKPPIVPRSVPASAGTAFRKAAATATQNRKNAIIAFAALGCQRYYVQESLKNDGLQRLASPPEYPPPHARFRWRHVLSDPFEDAFSYGP